MLKFEKSFRYCMSSKFMNEIRSCSYCSYCKIAQRCQEQVVNSDSTVQSSALFGKSQDDFLSHMFSINPSSKIPSSNCSRYGLLKPSPLHRTSWYCKAAGKEPCLSREWFAQLWLEERRKKKTLRKRNKGMPRNARDAETFYNTHSSFQLPFVRWFQGASDIHTQNAAKEVPHLKQPPLSQTMSGFMKPTSLEEVKVEPLLARANLLITRDIEWANLVLGFEQENRYAIVDPSYPQAPVGFIREQSNPIIRQILRTRRPFIAYITDAMGNELFRVRRPFWLITSTIYAEIDGKEIGVVHQRWHLWRRVYDIYLGKEQFAVVENPGFWNWTFTLKDINGNVLAEIDRDWRGIGFELFTDAGQYVIRFGHADPSSKTGAAAQVQELDITRALTLSERAVAVALAVSLDNDYFSRHGGWGIPFFAVSEE
ncbi:hypothetical protein AMTRI_Chr03g144920 [Amborella trichopoda]|uniref:Phospholipid scramblase n=1 Tax=Amborella trichopoda TaxID=13333 RepID=U5D075_AMBTC|nr:phospholipid scramblase family protein C343.06c [Amborella trichopoda]ERN15625.1 hypothetical protein AMTR_s00048p00189520 [Amborella trichopoda]|eukprot:XP_006854158.1 phospholipid scramblase family protein C343.06c [Amborella trichopoda]